MAEKKSVQSSNGLTLARTSLFTSLERHLAPDCERASQQRPADSLGRCESNGVQVCLFKSTVDLPGQVKLKKTVSQSDSFSSITYSLFKVER